jgi:ABC-2 type transport system permease protein
MSLVRNYASGAMAILKRDALLFASYRSRFASQLLSLVFSLTLFYYVSRLVHVGSFLSPDAYFAYVVIGLVVLETMSSTLVIMPLSLRQELVAGTWERLVVSPFGPVASVASMTIFPFLSAVSLGTVTIGLAALLFGTHVQWPTALLAVPVAAITGLAFAPFAFAIAAAVLAVKQAGVGAGFIVTGLSLVGGFFFPVSLLPGWIGWAADVQPFTPALDLTRHLLIGTPLHGGPWVEVARVAAFACVLLPVSLWVLGVSIRFGRRRGTIIEY